MAGKSRRVDRQRRRARRRAVLAVLGVALLAGAGWWVYQQRLGAGAEAALTAARDYLSQAQPARAIPLLRAALQTRPKDAEARELLGQAQLQAGNPAGALKELRRAIALGRDSEANRLGLARAHLLRGELDEAFARLASARDEASPDWQRLSAEVRAARGEHAAALPFFTRAIALAPAALDAYLGLARAQMALGDLAAAQRTLEEALERQVDGVGLWLLQGELGLARRDHDAALRAFARVLEDKPTHELALLGTASAELGSQRYEAAAAALDRLGEAAQNGPRAQFLRAMVAMGRREPRAALNHLRRVTAAAPAHRESLYQAARLHFELTEYGDAEHLLRRLLKINPDDVSALRMLEATQLAAGRFDPVAYDFESLERLPTQDPRMLALLGSALLRGGSVAASERTLSAAADADPASVSVERQLLLARLAAGKFDEVLAAAPRLREKGDTSVTPDVLLVGAHLGRHDLAAARSAAEALVAAHGEDAFAYNLLAFVEEAAGEQEAARASYQRALDIEPGYDGALLNLARLDLVAGARDAARAHYEAVLEKHADHPQALDGLALIALQDKQPARAIELWQQSRRANPEALRPRLLLAQQARAAGRTEEAIDYAREAWRVAPYAPGAQLEYCVSLLAANRNEEALPFARKLAQRFPGDGKLARLLAISLARTGNAAGLREVLGDMAKAAPGNLDARVALARLAVQEGRADAAASLAQEVAGLPGGAAVADELRGDAALAANDAARASTAYETAFTRQPTRELLLKLDTAERRAGRASERLVAWLAQHPDDMQVRAIQAARLQANGDDAAAIGEFERVLAAAPDSPVVRNNLAWLYRKIGDGRALEMARTAYELAPRRAEVADTYGWILLEHGRHEQALKILEQALELAPGNPDIRFHRASALERAGRDEDALRELEALLSDPAEFESRAQAEQLRYELQS